MTTRKNDSGSKTVAKRERKPQTLEQRIANAVRAAGRSKPVVPAPVQKGAAGAVQRVKEGVAPIMETRGVSLDDVVTAFIKGARAEHDAAAFNALGWYALAAHQSKVTVAAAEAVNSKLCTVTEARAAAAAGYTALHEQLKAAIQAKGIKVATLKTFGTYSGRLRTMAENLIPASAQVALPTRDGRVLFAKPVDDKGTESEFMTAAHAQQVVSVYVPPTGRGEDAAADASARNAKRLNALAAALDKLPSKGDVAVVGSARGTTRSVTDVTKALTASMEALRTGNPDSVPVESVGKLKSVKLVARALSPNEQAQRESTAAQLDTPEQRAAEAVALFQSSVNAQTRSMLADVASAYLDAIKDGDKGTKDAALETINEHLSMLAEALRA